MELEKEKRTFYGIRYNNCHTESFVSRPGKKLFLKDYPVKVIYIGFDLNAFRPSHDDGVRTKHRLDGRLVILSVASEWTPRKGLSDFVELSKQMRNVRFVVVGLTDKQFMETPSMIKDTKRMRS